MSNGTNILTPNERPRAAIANNLLRLMLIAVILAVVIGTFAYLGGWLTPNRLTPARFTDAFEQVDGLHPGFRRNHAKGVGVSGFFESNGQGVHLSKAAVFRSGSVLVIGRFSLNGGHPYTADTPNAVRGLGLQFTSPDGELWRTAMVNLPVVPFRTPEAFYEQLLASKPDPVTGKPDPIQFQAYLSRHPEAVRALAVIKSQPASSGFGNSTFRGLSAFVFTNASGDSKPARWLFTPEQPFTAADTATEHRDKNYLFETLIAQIRQRPLRWHLILVVGQAGDPTDDATIAWPADREQVDVGTLTLDQVESDETSAATGLNFDPLVLPAGITPSDDPLLSARSAIYSQSYTRRAGEVKQPPAITQADVQKGQ
jgi:catalase